MRVIGDQLTVFGELVSERAAHDAAENKRQAEEDRRRLEQAFSCLDCGVDTLAIGECYALHRAVWLEANPIDEGMLCIGCVEGRLGRQLTAADFMEAIINCARDRRRSARLRSRLPSSTGLGS
jgi:hypothetical protein